jgi:hypothetical protein
MEFLSLPISFKRKAALAVMIVNIYRRKILMKFLDNINLFIDFVYFTVFNSFVFGSMTVAVLARRALSTRAEVPRFDIIVLHVLSFQPVAYKGTLRHYYLDKSTLKLLSRHALYRIA